jgi:prepilin-type N-terminal cleavage/methylation domain-containing protein
MHNHPRRGLPAFTLIELMAVITIIVILAALVVGGLGFVTDRQAKEKAKVQIALISKSLEDYKLDMGEYPPTANKASTVFSAPAGTSTSSILFDYLYWDSDRDGSGVGGDTDQRIYLPELDPVTNKQGWTSGTASKTTKVLDPWGNEYCYRSGKGTTGKENTGTNNPDFDLWSMGKNGKSRPGDRKHADSADDIWNP